MIYTQSCWVRVFGPDGGLGVSVVGSISGVGYSPGACRHHLFSSRNKKLKIDFK